MATTKKTATSSKTSKADTKSAKPTSKTDSKPTTKSETTKTSTRNSANSASTTKKSSVTAKNTTKKSNLWKVILGILGVLLLAGLATFLIISAVNKGNENSLVVENGKGEKVETAYANFNEGKFRLKIPTSFKSLDSNKIKEEYGENAPNVIYVNNDASDQKADVTVSITNSKEAFSNDQVKTYLETMKSIFKVGADSIDSNYYEVDGHNVGTLKFTVKSDGEGVYTYMMFFSVDDKLNLVTFSCDDKVSSEWKPVGDFIIKSLEFAK